MTVDTEIAGTMSWDGRRMPLTSIPEFDTYDDHRMAMALAPASLYIPGIVIRDCDVVNKSYPGFWQDMADAGFVFRDADEPSESSELSCPKSNSCPFIWK